MNSVYLILAHNHFSHVVRLVKRLLQTDCAIILHVDVNAKAPRHLLSECGQPGRVFLATRRYATSWGNFDTVVATLALLREGVERFPDTRYFSLLSGQDYPIKTPGALNAFF